MGTGHWNGTEGGAGHREEQRRQEGERRRCTTSKGAQCRDAEKKAGRMGRCDVQEGRRDSSPTPWTTCGLPAPWCQGRTISAQGFGGGEAGGSLRTTAEYCSGCLVLGQVTSEGCTYMCVYVYTYISWAHLLYANAVGFATFLGFSELLVRCAKLSFRWGGGYVYTF